jgi:endonuclease YncB( thermonuclease family)
MAGTRDQSDRSSEHLNAPEVGRPRGSVWRPLYAEGISWEGQVFIVGAEHDLATRLIVTKTRLAFISGGDIALDIPRRWLKPDARQTGEHKVRISITPEGAIPGSADTDRLSIIVRDGNETAKLITSLTGKSTNRAIAEAPIWDNRVGAAPAMALPPLPEFGVTPTEAKRSWPPTGPEAVPPPAPRRTEPAKPAGESIAAWTSRNLDRAAPAPEPVPATVSRAATRRATLGDGKTVSDLEVPIIPPTPTSNVSWVVRSLQVAILAILLGTGWYFGGERIANDFSFEAIGNRLQELTSEDDPGGELAGQPETNLDAPTPTSTTAAGDGTGGAGQADLSEVKSTEESSEPGIGGTTEDLPTVYPTAEPTDEPAPADEPAPTDEPTTEPTNEPAPTDEPTTEPTNEPAPTDEPTAESTDEPAPTDEPTAEPTDEPAPTDEPTAEPTDEPAPTDEPTSEPTTESTLEPTTEPTVEATAEPTEEPSVEPTTAATTEPTATIPAIEPQAPSVDPAVTPAQETVAGPFRLTIEGAATGEEVSTALPEVQPVTYGEWLVLSVYARNSSGTEQVFDMSQFKLLADGEEVMLDTGNSWVGSMLGFTPAYSNTDAILWAPDEAHRFALTFLAPIDAETLVLQVGDQSIDLSNSIAADGSLVMDTPQPTAPEVFEATVVEVIDAETIVIEKDGVQQTVKYLGIDAPTESDCFAGEATTANSELVAGKTVRLERQATDTDAKGNWVRDVWVADETGSYTLVSQALVREGAAAAAISEPNTRFASWLTSSEASAQSESVGLWATCGETGDSSGGETPSVNAIERREMSFE